MSSYPSGDGVTWSNFASQLKSAREGSSAGSSTAGSLRGSEEYAKRYRNTEEEEVDTSDVNLFPPPNKTRQDALRQKRDPIKGWVVRGRGSDGDGGVNIYKREETMIALAVEGKTTLEAQLKVCSKPIIGLDHIIEFIDPDESNAIRIYHCQLCAVFRTAASILEHVCSYHHRVRTLRKKFPNESNMFLCPDRKTINRNPGLMNIATRRASEHELVYGRGEQQIRHERPSFPESEVDNEETDEVEILSSQQLGYLEATLKELKTLKIQSHEEMRVVKKIVDLLTTEMCDFKVANPTD